MSVNLILVTHDDIGSALLQTATTTLGGKLPLATTAISIACNADPDTLLPRLKQFANTISHQNELLILTDLCGSTPSNIANKISTKHNIKVITGLNLPMLIRIMNYSTLPLAQLVDKALTGGKDGIIQLTNTNNG